MSVSPHNFPEPDYLLQAAGEWLARRDRGLTATEQDEYLQWLRQDARHGRVMARMEKTWTALNKLTQWRPAHSAQPNPDLLARPRAHRLLRWKALGLGLAAAAAIAGAMIISRPQSPEEASPARSMRIIPRPERLTLNDGSIVELNRDGRIEVDFTPNERRVRLMQGEAHFTVAKNPARPFVVDAGAVAVRAVGTAFAVRRATAAVEVLVTEGKVRVERPVSAGTPTGSSTPLAAGERTVVDTTTQSAVPTIVKLSKAEIERSLAWQGVRLEFSSLPLAEVVAEFNLRNSNQVVIGDAETARLRVGGTFRADNIEGFVRLLQLSFGVTTEKQADGSIVLRHAK